MMDKLLLNNLIPRHGCLKEKCWRARAEPFGLQWRKRLTIIKLHTIIKVDSAKVFENSPEKGQTLNTVLFYVHFRRNLSGTILS